MDFATYPSLKEKVVIVTGGASGIGERTVRAFGGQGAKVGFLDIDSERGRALAAELAGDGVAVHFEACDLRDIAALRNALAGVPRRSGRRPCSRPTEATSVV
jgi:NAD(P)-dependent dehydrogenase (short-subunit alcohol dehydrogenase family)